MNKNVLECEENYFNEAVVAQKSVKDWFDYLINHIDQREVGTQQENNLPWRAISTINVQWKSWGEHGQRKQLNNYSLEVWRMLESEAQKEQWLKWQMQQKYQNKLVWTC